MIHGGVREKLLRLQFARCSFLILVGFQFFVFIRAAFIFCGQVILMVTALRHTTKIAIAGFVINQSPGFKFPHTIMQVYGRSHRSGEIEEGQYERKNPFHLKPAE